MNYEECVDLCDFLNWRMRKFSSPWYAWAVSHTWPKLRYWAKRLGYEPFKWRRGWGG